jgi:hypothetical protein
MFTRKRPTDPVRSRADAPLGDLRDPEYRRRYIFGDEPRLSLRRSQAATFLLFGALRQR